LYIVNSTQHSALSTQHSALSTQHSAFSTQPFYPLSFILYPLAFAQEGTMRTLILTILLLTVLTPATNAYWFNDPARGMTVVCDAPDNQYNPSVCALAGNRMLIAWTDDRLTGDNDRVYYQVLDYRGVPLLAPNGNRAFDGEWKNRTSSYIPVTLPDGQGGCILLVHDKRSGQFQFYGQRVDSLGNRLWGNNGRPLATWTQTSNMWVATDFTMDSTGNYFFTYSTNFAVTGNYAQRFDRNGNLPWGTYGIATCALSSADYLQKAVSNGGGGIINTWNDDRLSQTDLFGQYFNSGGQNLWTLNGILLQNNSFTIGGGVPDGAGGGIFVYDSHWNWYVFRVNGSGQVLWSDPFTNPFTCSTYQPIRHPIDGSVWTITDEELGGIWHINLYRFSIAGVSTFGINGISLGGSGPYAIPVVSETGVITTTAMEVLGRWGIRSARFDSTGQIVWATSLNVAPPNGGYGNIAACSDGADGILCAWEGAVTEINIYAQHLKADGTLGAFTPSPYVPNHNDPRISMLGYSGLLLTLPSSGQVNLELFDIMGRRVKTLFQGYREAGEVNLQLDTGGLAAGVYVVRLEAGGMIETAKVVVMK
jgi:hypothetical protein